MLIMTFCATALLIHLVSLGWIYRRKTRTRKATHPAQTARPAVSILRPFCGIENNLETTLRSTFLLDWPAYEVVFCVEDADDPAVPLVKQLMAEYPDVASSLLVGNSQVGINPKLNNLVKGWDAARYPWIVIADSNVLAPKDYLTQLFARWEPGTGMVCSPPAGTEPVGFAAEVEAAWLDSFQARWQMLADEIGVGFAQGKTMLLHRGLIDRAGGFIRLADEVAEDAASTKIVREAGLSVRLVDIPFPQPLGRRTWKGIWRRQLRWARLRRVSFPLFFLPEILVGSAFPLTAAIAGGFAGLWSPAAVLAYAAVWYGCELLVIRAFGWPLGRKTPFALVLRDLALPVLWLSAWFGNGFVWRGHPMAVQQQLAPRNAYRLRHAIDRTKAKARAFRSAWH
ncbi:ceramide glucosyltransferase [Ciceribacter azotifigens]|uniref:ceramide glucosyltransferase n=1 Tax=Ciceribacter azotifigens TaxID=2069303 RepID=UPI003A8650F7